MNRTRSPQTISKKLAMNRNPIPVPAGGMTVNQAAEFLGISADVLRTWRSREGGPPFVKFRVQVYYIRSALERWQRQRSGVIR